MSLIVILVGSDQFDLNMTVRTKCLENEEDEADQRLKLELCDRFIYCKRCSYEVVMVILGDYC